MKMMFRNRRLGISIRVTTSLAVVAFSLPVLGDAKSETQSRLLRDVKYLASDELQGRGVGTDGLNRAAEYIRDEFAKAGLVVSGLEGEAYQKFSMVTGSELGSPNTLQLAGPEGKTIDLVYDQDFRSCGFGGSSSFDAELVFCGYAIEDEEHKYRDLVGLDLQGKVAVIMRRVPQQANPHGPFNAPHGGISRHGALRSKVSLAVEQGAAAILFVNDPHTIKKNAETDRKLIEKAKERVIAISESLVAVEESDSAALLDARSKLVAALDELNAAKDDSELAAHDPLMELDYLASSKGHEIPIFHITQKTCDRLLQAALQKSLADIEAEIDHDLQPKSAVLTGWRAKGTSTINTIRTEVKNVIGVLEGEGPLAEETIVIGAHYDHVGMGGQGSLLPGSKAVHNGADDNASGSVGLLELARRFGADEKRLPRRLVFIAFTAEERGLIGSAHYVKNPLYPIEKTVAMFNMDMIGRLTDDKLTLFGTGTAPRWKEMIEGLGMARKFELTLKPGGFGPSDQSSFYAQKIPVLHFFTGTHGDYHRPSDDWDKVNIVGINRIIDMIEEVVVATAETPDRPEYVAIKHRESVNRGGSRPYFGSIPDFGSETKGYAISGVAPGSPAEKGGLIGGDSIIQLGKKKIAGLEDFDFALRGFSPGDDVDVVVLRKGKEVKLKVVLAKPR